MSKVGLDGTDIDALLTEDRGDSFSLNRVTSIRSSTMAYNTLATFVFIR